LGVTKFDCEKLNILYIIQNQKQKNPTHNKKSVSAQHNTPCLRDMNKIDLTIIRYSFNHSIHGKIKKKTEIMNLLPENHTRINTHTHKTHADSENHLIIQFKNYYKNDFSVSVNHQQQHCFSLLFFFARLNEQINE